MGRLPHELFRGVSAGGLVMNQKGKMLDSEERTLGSTSKGKVEVGEKLKEAAVREVEEETGISSLKLLKTWKPLTILTR